MLNRLVLVVKLLKRLNSSGGVIYEKPEEGLIITFSGNQFTTECYDPLKYTGAVTIDWGDGNTTIYTEGFLSHAYSLSNDYTIKIQGIITAIQSTFSPLTHTYTGAFQNMTGIRSIIIPRTITKINPYCFIGCSNLTSITLKWDNENEIVGYNSSWILNANSNLKFYIPIGTTSLYIAKGYPSDKLVERNG